MNPLLTDDLRHVLEHTEGLWQPLQGARLFITGGTGFFGTWLLESFIHANRELGLDARMDVLTRNPEAFARKVPHLALDESLRFVTGDVADFQTPSEEYRFIIHAAGDPAMQAEPRAFFEHEIAATRRTLELARAARAERYLYVSSGAVYGRQPPELEQVTEDYRGAPDPLDDSTAYAQGKRASEFLCACDARRPGLHVVIARCFAFLGPYLPLAGQFAAGNFIRDALEGGPIRISGDGTPRRSYLYTADLVIWLWTILLRGQSGRAYNVGASEPVSICELGQAIARAFEPAPEVMVARQPDPASKPSRYVPSIQRVRDELGLIPRIGLDDGISRTVRWFQSQRKSRP